MNASEFEEEGAVLGGQAEASADEDWYQKLQLTVDPKQEPIRIDKFLTSRMRDISRNRLQHAAHAGYLAVNQRPVKPNYKIKPGDIISLIVPRPPRETEAQPEPIDLDIRYEDDHLMLIHKPAGMVVHPGVGHPGGTLVNGLLHHFGQLPKPRGDGGAFRPGLVHRIDKDTSGLLVVAKDEYSLSHLAGQFAQHTIERSYQALVWGDVEAHAGTIDVPIGRDPRFRQRQTAFSDRDQGKEAVTHYTVLERFIYATHVSCRLETGRTHQIRVHMKHLGHPLFADVVYGGMEIAAGPTFTRFRQFVRNTFQVLSRQALHASSLGFVHPHTGKTMYFEAEPPEDFLQGLARWRQLARQLEQPEL